MRYPFLAILAIFLALPGLAQAEDFTFPNGIQVGGIDLGEKTESEATSLLERKSYSLANSPFSLTYPDGSLKATLAQLGIIIDWQKSLSEAKEISMGKGFWARSLSSLRQGANGQTLSLYYNVDEEALNSFLEECTDLVRQPENASLEIDESTIRVVPEKSGQLVNIGEFNESLARLLDQGQLGPVALSFVEKRADLKSNDVGKAFIQVLHALRHPPVITFENQQWEIDRSQVSSWLTLSTNDTASGKELVASLNRDKVNSYLKENVVPEVEQEVKNAKFSFQNGYLRTTSESADGRELMYKETIDKLDGFLKTNSSSVELVVKTTEPTYSSSNPPSASELGTKELLAEGRSDFSGSPKNRRFNIDVGAERFNGIIITPGEEFSFNDILGEVDGEHGFLPELVIKTNKTVPEFGGGLCQVSTTAFRAAINSGLKITERRNHSYPVHYYYPTGLDATIYPGVTDLRFLNDTPGHILVETRIEEDELIYAFYGTNDGRKTEIIGPRRFDIKPDGSMKAIAYQEVYRDGELLWKDTFYSKYRSPKEFPTPQEIERRKKEEEAKKLAEAEAQRIAEKDRKLAEEKKKQEEAAAAKKAAAAKEE